jgi:deazaflavin-dependent oxidoreductase (nitroreductase family)
VTDSPPDLHAFNRAVIEEFRANDGQVPSMGMDVLLLEHQGERSGTRYTSPLVYTTDGDRYVVIASKGGQPEDPQWYRNLVAHPEVEIEVGTERVPVRATPASGAERERLYDAQASKYPQFEEYASMTSRAIPVVVLERR